MAMFSFQLLPTTWYPPTFYFVSPDFSIRIHYSTTPPTTFRRLASSPALAVAVPRTTRHTWGRGERSVEIRGPCWRQDLQLGVGVLVTKKSEKQLQRRLTTSINQPASAPG